MNESERDEMLIRIDERTHILIGWKDAHQTQHWRQTALMYGVLLSAVITLSIMV